MITTTLKLIASSLNQPLKKNSSLIRQCLQAVTALTAGRSISKLLISVCQIGFEFHSLFYGSMVTMTFHTSFFVNLVCIEVNAFEVDEPLMPYKASRVFFSHNDQDKIISILILYISLSS